MAGAPFSRWTSHSLAAFREQDGDHPVIGMVAPIEPNEFLLGSDYLEWRRRQQPFRAMTTWSGLTDCDITDQSPMRVRCARVESNFLDTLGIQPVLGRNFTAGEDRPNAPPVALLSYGLWQARFAADPNVIGKTLVLDGSPAAVVGVLHSRIG